MSDSYDITDAESQAAEQDHCDDLDGYPQLHAEHDDGGPFSEYDQISTIADRIDYRTALYAKVAHERHAA